MADFKAAQKVIDTEIKEIETGIEALLSRIASMETEKVELRRRRNAFAPIHAELEDTSISYDELEKTIYDGSSAFDRSNDKSKYQDALYRQVSRPPALQMSHICHIWRELTMGSSECWSHIQICDDTIPDMLRFMWHNAGDQLIDLEYGGTPPHLNRLPNPATVALLQEMLASSLGRFKSFASFRRSYDSGKKVSDLLSVVTRTGRADHLQSVVLKEQMHSAHVGNDNFLAGGTPLLRTLVFEGISISWRSRVLASPQLTLVELTHTPEPTPETVIEFLSFLASARQLRSLLATFPMVSPHQQWDFTAVQSAFRTPIPLSSIDLAFQVVSIRPEPLLAILPAIRIRKNIPKLVVVCMKEGELLQECLANSLTSGIGSCPWVPPEQLHFGDGMLLGLKKARIQWIDSSGSGHAPRRCLQIVGILPSPADPIMLLPLTAAYRLPWSYTHIRAVIFERSSVSTHTPFWKVLARQRSLEYVRLPATESHDFLQQMDEGLEAESELDAIPDSGETPFPGLLCIHFYDVKAELGNADRAFLNELEEVLRIRQRRNGAPRLRELAFYECSPWVASTDLPKLFSPMVDSIIWDGEIIL